MKFHKADEGGVSVAIAKEGRFETSSMEAGVFYEFDSRDKTVKLEIDSQWFNAADIDDLIAFLQFAKTYFQDK